MVCAPSTEELYEAYQEAVYRAKHTHLEVLDPRFRAGISARECFRGLEDRH
jgi:hypothetical protein